MERSSVLPYVSSPLVALAGLAWLVQGFLPLAERAPLKHTSALDLARLAHNGPLSTLLPGHLVLVLLVVPLAGCVLVALTPFSGVGAQVGRLVAVVLGGVVVALQVLAVLGGTSGSLGAGTWCAVAGLVLGVAGVLVGLVALLGAAGRSPGLPVSHTHVSAFPTLINQEKP